MPRPKSPRKTSATTATVTLTALGRDGSLGAPLALQPVNLQRAAMKWSYLASNRAKWQNDPEEDRNVDALALALADDLGLNLDARIRLAGARLVEVAIPWISEEDGWELRVLPWEFFLVRILRPLVRGTGGPLIVRQLTGRTHGTLQPVRRVLGVTSCPREFEAFRTSYAKELELVAGHLTASPDAPEFVKLPDAGRSELEALLAAGKGRSFDAIHFLSVEATGPLPKRSYVWLPDEKQARRECDFEEVALLVTSRGKRHPRLVAYSFCSTGPRLAAYTVAEGAQAAIGFQDLVTDEQCESFFGHFYHVWQGLGWNVLAAFEAALLRVAPLLQGTGIILWTDRSLLASLAAGAPTVAPIIDTRAAATRPPPLVAGGAPPAPVAALRPGDLLDVEILPIEQINYAVLHNLQVKGPKAARRSLFDRFLLRQKRPTPGPLEIEIEVRLFSGDETSWRRKFTLTNTSTDFADQIHVPLTSVLARSLRESLRTTIETTIKLDGVVFDTSTHPVSLLAIEEWLDDGVCHIWLPSFVLPRDPAVSEIVQRSRRSLGPLADDFSAGFDGYQHGLPERVDLQVQAIWSTLCLEWPLGYINPPPTFSARSQRLRRPGEILREGSGTCLDLALLLAACLEYIDLRPVLILAPGHAYAGWWRTEDASVSFSQDVAPGEVARDEDRCTLNPGIPLVGAAPSTVGQMREPSAWTKGKEAHDAIVKAVAAGDLAVIETTGLTRRLSFAKALREGTQRLRSRLEFECLIDLYAARARGVTPLPLCL